MKEIKNIVLDFNGVISKSNKKEILNSLDFKDVCNLVCYGFSFLTKSGFKKDIAKAYRGIQVGKETCDSIFELFDNTFPNNSETVKKVVNNFVNSMKTRQGLISMIDYLRENGFQVFILSNSIPKTERMIKSEEIRSHFDGVYCSSEHGLSKPGVDVFKDACEKWGILPEESLFVDDKKQNVKGALDAGFKKAECLTKENDIVDYISENAK